MTLLDPIFGQIAANQMFGNQLALAQQSQMALFQQAVPLHLMNPWGFNQYPLRFASYPEMSALLARHQREVLELQFRIEADQARSMKDFAARMEAAADQARIEAAPELWRRLDECRRRHGLPS